MNKMGYKYGPQTLSQCQGWPGPYPGLGTFKKTDPRADLAVEPVDPRIHFALVCGAKSCPPIRLYSAANLEEGLQVSSTTFPPLSNFLSQTKRRLLPLDSPD